MTVIEFKRDEAFGLAIDDGFGEFYARLGFEAIDETSTKISTMVDVPLMSETADTSILMEVAERWLRDTEHLI